jgi:hypothetical protein
MARLGKRKSLALLLPLLVGFAFQATQYARAPVDYEYYVVYGKNADIALKPGTDLSPNGQTLIQNSSSQEGLYTLSLGKWGPGYIVNYTDAFRVTNREAFNVRMVGFNFTAASTGGAYLRIYVQNDTDDDGVGDTWIEAWDGTTTVLSPTNFIYFKATATYGNDGGSSQIRIDIVIPSTGVGISQGTPELNYSGQLVCWFTSITF